MITLIFNAIIIAIVVAVVVKYALKGRDKVSEFKKLLGTISLSTKDYGMRKIPTILMDISTSDEADAVKLTIDALKLFAQSPETIISELDLTFNSVLQRKLATTEGRNAIQAALAAAPKS